MQKLGEIKGLSDAKVEKLLDAARKLCVSYGWQTAKIIETQVSGPKLFEIYHQYQAVTSTCWHMQDTHRSNLPVC